MDLTVEQALKQGVASHEEGKLQEAEQFYRAILQVLPEHPDANHNLGVLLVSINKTQAAMPLFKTAVETNPGVKQFWLSYIDALIKEKQFDIATQVLEQARGHGVNRDGLSSLEAQVTQPRKPKTTESTAPPQETLDSLLRHYQSRRFNEAEKLAKSITHDFPEHQFAWKALGTILLGQSSKRSQAIHANQTAVRSVGIHMHS